MTATTHSEFGANTEALEVAKAFAEGIVGKTVLVTGVNPGGIGFTAAQAFASQSPAHLIVAGRTESKLNEAIKLIKADYPHVDCRTLLVNLGSQKSVRAAASDILARDDLPTIDIIVNSAGVMGVDERTLSEDGVELHLATNHIGHWLLTCLLMPKLIQAAKASPKGTTRIVNVSAHSPTTGVMRFSDINFDQLNKDLPTEEQPDYQQVEFWGYKDVPNKKYTGIQGYCQSKVANLLFGVEANKRLYEKHGILTLGVHPGVIRGTELERNFPAENLAAIDKIVDSGFLPTKSVGAGSSTSLVAALDPKLGAPEAKDGQENYGAYMADCQINETANPRAVSSSEAEKLWKLSEELVKEKFDW
ncbi:NAD(P)-binding protein [Xylariaceae sp. FL1272]|nr:NAD(P)-binding protein [Xylariaceae sp. FL1272]